MQRADVELEVLVRARGAECGLHDCVGGVCVLHMLLVDCDCSNCSSCCAVAWEVLRLCGLSLNDSLATVTCVALLTIPGNVPHEVPAATAVHVDIPGAPL